MSINRLLKFELNKLLSDTQYKAISIFCYMYIFYFLHVLKGEGSTFTFIDGCRGATHDIIFMIFFSGIISSTVFGSDYSKKTFKNFLPYVGKGSVFISKVLVIFIGVFIFLVGWYSVAIIGSLFISKNIDLVFKPIILRFITQYFMIAFHSSIILLITIKTQSRAISSAFSIICGFLYTLIIINGKIFLSYITDSTAWGQSPNYLLIFSLVTISLIMCIVSYMFFKRQEVSV